MTNRVLACFACAVALGLLTATPGWAQSTSPTPATFTPVGDVFAGVAIWSEDEDTFTGFHVSASWRPTPKFALVGDMVGYGERTTLMAGVRVQSTGRHSMFVQVLAGSAPLDDIALQPGLGFDYRISRRLAARAAADVKFAGDDGSTYIGTRLSFGLVYLFGR